MLKSISLENYKCFEKLKVDDKDELEIAPLTVLCGVNSSGKSSILKSLLMLKQSYENTLSTNEMTFNGKYVDNGMFEDVVYNGNRDHFTIKNSFFIEQPPKAKVIGISESDATTFNELIKIFKNYELETSSKINLFLFDVEIEIHGNLEEKDISKRIKNVVFRYNVNIKLLNGDMNNYSSITNDDIFVTLNYSSVNEDNQFGRKYDVIIKNIPYDTDTGFKIFDDILTECSCYFEGIKLVKLYKSKPKEYLKLSSILPNIYSIFRIISTQYRHIKHLSPLRISPNRRYIYDENINSTGSGGEFTAQALYRYKGKKIRFYTPPNYKGEMKPKISSLMNAIRIWADYLNMGDIEVAPTEEMLKISFSGRNISDVGFGISQCLPVITEGLLLNKNETLLLEQPEVHLHPKMQMNIADFLIATSKSNKNIIVETHSDHIINRIVKRIIQDDTGVLNKNILILFLTKDNNGNPIFIPVIIDDSKGIVNWPVGFFDQFQNEQEEIIRAGLEKRKRIRESKLGD